LKSWSAVELCAADAIVFIHMLIGDGPAMLHRIRSRTIIRPEVETFIMACERLLGFTHASGRLTPDECEALEHFVVAIQKQIAPLCTDRR
jgi:hypothetical protein